MLGEMTRRFGADSGAKILAGEVVDAFGRVIDRSTIMPPGSVVFLYRDLPGEVEVPFDIPVIYRDDDIVVVDKPHFLATMPRGAHVAQTALVRLRRELRMPELSPAHRLDRLTAGVLLFTARQEIRGRYQSLFAHGLVNKVYLARSRYEPTITLPQVISNRIVKNRGSLQATIEPGVPNAHTLIEQLVSRSGEASGEGSFRLTPRTGRTHQLRLHMASIGSPIENDPLYPHISEVAAEDFSAPLALVAHRLEFDDPITGNHRCFVSSHRL